MSWALLQPTTEFIPSQRRRAVMNFHNGIIYIFGGYDFNYLGGLFSFNTFTNIWREIKTEICPCNRSGHSSVILDGNIYIYGGDTNSETIRGNFLLDDFWKFNTKEETWEKLETETKNKPSPRYFHSMCTIYEKYFVLYGGFNGVVVFDDFFYFNLKELKWNKILKEEQVGDIPYPMLSHSSVSYLDYVFVYGGSHDLETTTTSNQHLFEFNFYLRTWKSFSLDLLPPRCNATMTIFDHFVLFFGGYDETSQFSINECFYNDLHVFDIWKQELKEIQVEHGKLPEKRTKQSGVQGEEKLFIFGGLDCNDQDCNDLHSFELGEEYLRSFQFSSNLIQMLDHSYYLDSIIFFTE
jgi:N-acetylneuraminic acid mutarotase